ncbi:MAG: Glycosyl transferase group 1, partial [Microgenomates group bacterium GW2011_GWC1_37_8]
EKKIERRKPPRILYGVTNFEWLQNQEATEILINKVWPLVKKSYPSAKVWVVGRKIPLWLKENAKNNTDIELTENIPDARDAYRKASIMIAPIKGSGGTRLKILEAMATSLPVVSTKVGIAGLNLKDGENVLIADTPEEISQKALMLLQNQSFAEKIGRAGQKHVQELFDWESIVKMHDSIYIDLLKK